MKMDQVANSRNDEFYTPEYAIIPLIKYLKERNFNTIWCPFDTDESNFCKVLKREGFLVVNTHLDMGIDFFTTEIPECDAIVSNPPYSLKGEIFYKLFSINKPFAMLVGVVGLFESEFRFSMFKANEFEIMYLNRRVAYFKSYSEQKPSLNPPFSSVYITSKILPSQMCFERITKK